MIAQDSLALRAMEFPLEIDPVYHRLIITTIVLVGMYLLVRGAQRATLSFVHEPQRRYRTSKLIGRFGGIVSLILLILIWGPAPDRLVTILSVVGAGLAIANREAILSLAGRLNIALRAPYQQGDRIEVNGIIGDVIDIRFIHTSMMEVGGWVGADQSTGRIVHIPHSWVFQYGVFNYTQGFSFIWNELSITVAHHSDWEAAREIMLDLSQESAAIVEQIAARQIRQMSREYLVHYSILTPFVYVQIVHNGVRLTLRYLCEVRKRRGTTHALTVSMLRKFEEHGRIELVESAPPPPPPPPAPAPPRGL